MPRPLRKAFARGIFPLMSEVTMGIVGEGTVSLKVASRRWVCDGGRRARPVSEMFRLELCYSEAMRMK